jgi:hypothetical protein
MNLFKGFGLFLAITSISCVSTPPTQLIEFTELDGNARIEVKFTTTGCFHHDVTYFVFEKNESFACTIREGTSPDPVELGVVDLSSADLFGLKRSFDFYRADKKLSLSTNKNVIEVGYFRCNRKIGSELFVDRSDAESLLESIRYIIEDHNVELRNDPQVLDAIEMLEGCVWLSDLREKVPSLRSHDPFGGHNFPEVDPAIPKRYDYNYDPFKETGDGGSQ